MATIGAEIGSTLVTTNVTDDTQEYDTTRLTISAFSGNSSYIIKNGILWATGDNTFGKLGLGDTVDVNVFTSTGIADVKNVVGGTYHTFILKTNGSLWVTGRNNKGQLGLGDNVGRVVFTDTGITDVKEIYCGYDSSFIIKNDGTLLATGLNLNGQLGLGDNTDVNSFTSTGITNARSVSIYQHTLLIKEDGSLFSTGLNNTGQLGLGDNIDVNVFTSTGISNIKMAIAGGGHSSIIRNDDTLWTTGGNSDGQLGLGDTVDVNVFTDTGIADVKNVENGFRHSLIVKNDDTLWTTGYNFFGQLGLGDNSDRNSFTDTGVTGVNIAKGGLYHSIIIKLDDTIWSTGEGSFGQLGLGDNSPRTSFTDTSETSDTYVAETWILYYNSDTVQMGDYLYTISIIGNVEPSLFTTATQIGYINPLKPFDGQNITPAISSSPMTYKITGTEEFNAFTLAKVLATSVTYTFRDETTAIIKTATVAIDCKRDTNGILSLYPTTVVYYADQQMPIGSTVEITITNTEGNVELGDFPLNNTIDSGYTDLTFSHGIIDYNEYTPDAWGNIPEAVKAIVTTFKVTLDFPLSNYDYAVSFNESISGKNVTIDASDSNGAVADGETIFGALTRRVRVTSPSISSKIKDGKLDTMATLSLTVEEIV